MSDLPAAEVPAAEAPMSETPAAEGPTLEEPASEVPAPGREQIVVLDVVVGVSALAAATAAGVGRRARRVVRPAVGLMLRPPLVPRRYRADTLLSGLAQYGLSRRPELRRQLAARLAPVLPEIVAVILEPLDLTEIVKNSVDLDEVVAGVDLDKAVERLDLNKVLVRLDIPGLAEGVIAEVDLAEIIRQSTGSVASETVRGVRMQSIAGDEAIGRAVGRIRLRLGRKVPATEP